MGSKFKFGDLICYKSGHNTHDDPLIYVGPCGHREGRLTGMMTGLIDIIAPDVPSEINHKDPSMWQTCWHITAPVTDD